MRTLSSSVRTGVRLTLKSAIFARTSASWMAKIRLHHHRGGNDRRAPAAALRTSGDHVFDVNAREFYPQNHTEDSAGVAQ